MFPMPRFRKTENSGEENGRKAEADDILTLGTVGRGKKGTTPGTHGEGGRTRAFLDGGAENGKESGRFNERREGDYRGIHRDSPAVHDIVGGNQGGSGESGVVREASGREGGLLQTDSAGVEKSTAGRCNCGFVHLPLPWEQHHVPWACVVSPGCLSSISKFDDGDGVEVQRHSASVLVE